MKRLIFTGLTILFCSIIPVLSQTQYWFKTNCPNNMNILSLAVSSGGKVFAGTQGDGVYCSDDGGGTWTQTAGTGVSFNYLTFSSIGQLYAATDNGILHYTGTGNVWEQLSIDDASVVAINSSGEIYAGLSLSGISKSTDNGVTWDFANNGLTSNLSKMVASMGIDKNGNIYIGTCEGIFKSTDNGGMWLNIGLSNKAVNSLKINSQGGIFVGTSDGILYYSTDQGNVWEQKSTWSDQNDIRAIEIAADGSIFVGSLGGGVYISHDEGTTWSQTNSGIADPPVVYSFAISPDGYIYAGTLITNVGINSGGVFKSVNPVSNIKENPELMKIIQIFPNPSHGDFFVSSNESGTFTFYILDILGNVVLTQKDQYIGEKLPYRLDINNLSSGVYVLHFILHDKAYHYRIAKN